MYSADPAGFGDGLASGWNGLIATLNGIVVGADGSAAGKVAVDWAARDAARRGVPLTIVLCLAMMRPLKGLLIALQYRNQAAEGRPQDPS